MKNFLVSWYSSVDAAECRDANDGSKPKRLYTEFQVETADEALAAFNESYFNDELPFDIEVEEV